MKFHSFSQWLRIILFSLALAAGCVVGFLLFLRPTESPSEQRTLAKFPTYSTDRFLNGDYTAEISLWYSDTFPGREQLLAWNTRLRGLYGITVRSAQSGGQGDLIQGNETFVWDTVPSLPSVPEGTKPSDVPEESGDPETTTSEIPLPPPGSEVIEGYLVDGINGYQLYYFNQELSDSYARLVVQAALDLNGVAQVYDMVVPLSYTFGVPADVQQELGVSDGRAAIDYMYRAIATYCQQAGVENPVVTIDIADLMEAHYDEYVYFRTDHHWTAKGAYYASRAFLNAAGKDYPLLSDYTVMRLEGFRGTLAGHTQAVNPTLSQNPDFIEAYIPVSVNEVHITTAEGESLTLPLVDPAAEYANLYRCFIGGDYPLSVAHNPAIGDGSKVLVVKESFGNAFMPMLVDSYEYVYAIDYRFFKTSNLTTFVKENHIDTVLFLNNLAATSASYNVSWMESLVRRP